VELTTDSIRDQSFYPLWFDGNVDTSRSYLALASVKRVLKLSIWP